VRFDIVAHSMGGLLVRYLIRYGDQPLPGDGSLPQLDWSGAKLVDRAVLVGTPNGGSVQAFWELLHGSTVGPFLPCYAAAILGTMPATYQLLPRVRHGAYQAMDGMPLTIALDPGLWAELEWGLADPEQDRVLKQLLPGVGSRDERLAIALDHQGKCLNRADQFFRALDIPARPPEGTELMLVAGDSHETRYAMKIDQESGEVHIAEGGQGDGTVLRSSALLDERVGNEWSPGLKSPITWERVFFFFDDHLGLTRNPGFMDNLLYLLLEEPR
jgi:pimeloyl-ACP methyl ester carboxylesterase